MSPLPMGNAQPKPAKGSHWLAVRQQRAERKNNERREMDAAKRRDGHTCRWPRCEYISQKPRIECAHVFQHRGMGGDKSHGQLRTQRRDLMALCFIHHESLDIGDLQIEAQTKDGTDGPCDFKELMFNSGRYRIVASEQRIGVSVRRGR